MRMFWIRWYVLSCWAPGEDKGTPSWWQRGDADPHLFLQLDRTTDFEERRLIRNAMRELRQRKRGTWGR